ncbi:MAG: formylglycine-generating enzyme family protein [Acidobacteria bacterium]|nr:formylglycine-generating enzyme family protein [Acidobacteriota bacterium]
MRRLRIAEVLAVAVLTVVVSGTGSAGTWSKVPEAVSRLRAKPSDAGAIALIRAAGDSCLAEARAGHLAATRELIDAFDELVSPAPDSQSYIDAVHRKAAQELVKYGDRSLPTDSTAAGTAWALAAELAPDAAPVERLRRLLLPPRKGRPGQIWTSPIDGAELVWLPPFRFLMGCTRKDGECQPDEKYLRWVTTRGFWIERREVTNARYRLCVDAGACTPPEDPLLFDEPGMGSYALAGVTWSQAVQYATWAGRRLPSEAQWERAARGKKIDWRYPWGNYKMRSRANVRGIGGADVFQGVAPVASFPWTGWGIYDIAGNVWEWCQDTYHEVLVAGPKDGSVWVEGGKGRVVRGGSWRRDIELARVSSRRWHEESYRADDLGFRCVAAPSDSIGDDEAISIAQAAFPIRVQVGKELDRAALDRADRNYLDRRAVTWLAVEGRPWEALPRAVVLLDRNPDDPVAKDLLDGLEGNLEQQAARGDVRQLERWLNRYTETVGRSKNLASRVGRLDRRIAGALKKAGLERKRQGDTVGAGACFRLALRVNPGDQELKRLAQSVIPEPGAVRTMQPDNREVAWVPSGSYLMGRGRGDDQASTDEQPAHTVFITGFWMDRREVTNGAYRRCVEAGACTPPHKVKQYDDPAFAEYPVLWVDWFQARAYAKWAGKRLPTEAEWEYAARAGASTRYPWGDQWQPGAANAIGTAGADHFSGPSPVGSFLPNAWGLFDMIGNAREWVEDAYHPSYTDAPNDGRAWNQVSDDAGEPSRVLRGGSYGDFPVKQRVSRRSHKSPENWTKTTGFRCAADR